MPEVVLEAFGKVAADQYRRSAAAQFQVLIEDFLTAHGIDPKTGKALKPAKAR